MAMNFNPQGEFVATRNLLLNGQTFRAGDAVPIDGLSLHRLKQLVANRQLTLKVATPDEAPEGVIPLTPNPAMEPTPVKAGSTIPTVPKVPVRKVTK